MSNEKEPQKSTEEVEQEVQTEAKGDAVEQQEELVLDEAAGPAEETVDAPAEVDEVAALKEELEAEQNKYLRLLADYDNFKRRAQKDRQDAEKFRSQSLLVDLLPVMDNFDRALSVETKSEESASLLKGVEMVQKSLLEAVKREGLEEIKALGEPFDPNFHQAVMQEKDETAEPGIVLMELQKGYTLKGRVLRPAMVKVNE
ncbi:nucleotide exchange factor GrpE [Planococcus sp. NCCP-2050]|uniref:nucleotide exchange factor GrpE n=1 Tax=Planococcus sp. NCCP-2050 TaxID=2944679 RepID=UPI002086BAFE|nr:nucleotide exchange factor GrpE [Planococcus sp. NCCP-2050]GKW46885.1 protein GrpE [Planococcus sp. NCCP-2050]